MEQLLKDKQYFKFITGRSRLRGRFDRDSIRNKYESKEWLKLKVDLSQILEVIDQVETMCHRFIVNRIIFVLYLFCAMLALTLFIIGIIVNVQVTKSDSGVKLYNFWDLSWPYFSCFFFIPLIALGLFFINKHYLNKYEKMVSQYFADININIFEKQSVVWKVGLQCAYLDLSQTSKLRSKSQEFSPRQFPKEGKQNSKGLDIENKNIQMGSYDSDSTSNDNSFHPKEINSHSNYQKEYYGGEQNPEVFDNSAL